MSKIGSAQNRLRPEPAANEAVGSEIDEHQCLRADNESVVRQSAPVCPRLASHECPKAREDRYATREGKTRVADDVDGRRSEASNRVLE
jgi:hypothetical protein